MGAPTTKTNRGPAGWTLNAFPVMADLGGRRVLVVGGGHTAEEKIRLLVDADAHLEVVSPAVTPAVEGFARRGSIVWHRRRFRPSDVEGAFFVVAATDDPVVNRTVFDAAERTATLCNAVDDTANCSAILPSVHREGLLVVTVSTSGAAPALAVRLREQIARLTVGSGDALEVLAGFRGRIKDSFETFAERRDIWYRIVDSPAVELARHGEKQRARQVIAHMIEEAAGDPFPANSPVTRADRRIVRALEWSTHPVVTVSGQLGGLVLVDLIRQHRPDIDVVFVDTGYHPPESIAFIKDVARKWDLALRVVAADTDVVTHEAEHGPLYLTDPARCCEIRKLSPAGIGLSGHDVWFTALRREQAESRRDEQSLTDHTLDDGRRLWKINPLVDWTWENITTYADSRQIPRHPLYADGYTSIGCAPCTTPTHGVGDDRAGRWSGTERIECGLHIAQIATGGKP